MIRRLDEAYRHGLLDGRYQWVWPDGVGQSRAAFITLGIGWDGRRCVLLVEPANRARASRWNVRLVRVNERDLHGVRLAASRDHDGLKWAIMATLPEAHGRSALDCLTELRWLDDRHAAAEAGWEIAQALAGRNPTSACGSGCKPLHHPIR